MSSEIVEVYRARSGFQAHAFVEALEEAGIKAHVQGAFAHPATATGSWGNAGAQAEWWDAPRITVHAADAARAREIILALEGEELRRAAAHDSATGPPVEVVCEECGKTTSFPVSQRGTVQNCGHCGAYVDVEDGGGAEPPESSAIAPHNP